MRWKVSFPAFLTLLAGQASPAVAANLTIPTGGRVSVELIASYAAYSNTMSVASPGVDVAISGCQLEPAGGLGGVHIVSEKLSQRGCRADLDADPTTSGIDGFPAGQVFEFGMCAQTDGDPTCEFVWSSNPANNPDGDDHVATVQIAPGAYRLSWEDLPDLGDNDFNDLIVVVRVQADTDGDGLWDDWEQNGIDTDGLGGIELDLPALGARFNHKDIFLEIDYLDCTPAGGDCPAGDTHSHQPKQAAIAAVVAAFADSPEPNPDGTTGIDLHVDVDDPVPHRNFVSIGCVAGGGFDDIKSDPAYFGPANPRRFAYHYAIFGHRQGAASPTYSGCGELPGNDFLVTLGDWNTHCIGAGPNGTLDTAPSGDDLVIVKTMYSGPDLTCDTTASGDDAQWVASGASPTNDLDGDGLDDRTVGTVPQQAGTLIHEFGHNLRLCHGGEYDPPAFTQCNANYKPNYVSAMNYSFQLAGIPPTDPDAGGPLIGRVDFSAEDLPDLDENNLSETTGVGDGADDTWYRCPNGTRVSGAGTGAIDWNCDADGGVDTGVASDINADGTIMTLGGYDDWANLKLDFQNTSDFEDGVHQTTEDHVEIDAEIAVALATPVARCRDATVATEPGVCRARASVDGGSFDPDGGLLTLSHSPEGPYPLGDTSVTLTATDATGLFGTCSATVTVEDREAPSPSCNAPASIVPPDAPVSFTATTGDNCGATVVATAYDCYAFTSNGKRVDKTRSCRVQFAGDTVTILDTGGVGDHVAWTLLATDGSGNTTSTRCEVVVVNPGRSQP